MKVKSSSSSKQAQFVRPTTFLSAAALLSTLLIGGSIGSTPASADSAPAGASAESVGGIAMSQLVADGEALRSSNLVQDFARTNFPNVYSGIVLKNNSSQVVVYLTAPSPLVEEALNDLVPKGTLQFEYRTTLEVEQEAAHEAIRNAEPQLEAEGFAIASFGPDAETGKELVTVIDATPSQLDLIVDRFGSAVIAKAVLATAKAVSDVPRVSDTAPWNAGDFISDGNGDCTSGIPTHNPAGQKFLVTAAHCFALNAAVYNYAASLGLGTKTKVGTVAARDLRDSYYDAELVVAPSPGTSNLTFTGPTSTSSKAAFNGSGAPVAGATVCTSGAFEGENCLSIISVNACLTAASNDFGRTVCGENYYYSSNTQSIGQGDSGGPVYSYNSGGVQAMGLHNLHDQNYSVACTNWASQAPGRLCSGHGWFVSIGPVMSTWNLSVN